MSKQSVITISKAIDLFKSDRKLSSRVILPLIRKGSNMGRYSNDPYSTNIGNTELSGMEAILKFLEDDKNKNERVLIIKAGTGNGKSTIIPYFITQWQLGKIRYDHKNRYKHPNKHTKRKVICTQPRRVTAQNTGFIASFRYKKAGYIFQNNKILAENPRTSDNKSDNFFAEPFGSAVGYTVGGNKSITNNTKLEFVTEEILLLRLQRTDEPENVANFILLDEVHERTIPMDLLMSHLKKLYQLKGKNCPYIILMSATFNPQAIADYFGVSNANIFEFAPSPAYTVTGAEPLDKIDSLEPINKPHYPVTTPENYIEYMVSLIKEIHIRSKTTDFATYQFDNSEKTDPFTIVEKE